MSSVDLHEHVSMQIKVLDFFGLSLRIPYSRRSVYYWVVVLFQTCLVTLVHLTSNLAQTVYLIRLIMSGKAEIQEVASVLNLVLTESLATFKLLEMRYRRNTWESLYAQFNSQEFYHTSGPLQVILARAVRLSRWLFVGLLFGVSMDVLVHVVVVPGLNRFESLPLKMDFIFFDVNDPKYFNFVCAYQILYKPTMISTFVVQQTLPWAAMNFAVSQLDVLIYNIENMKEFVKAARSERCLDEHEAFRQIFKGVALHHAAIIRFVKTLQDTFSWQLASSLFVSAGIMGMIAMQFLSIDSPLSNLTEVFWVFIYLMLFTGMLFVDSYFGNSVTTKSAYLPTAVFACPWTNLTPSLKKNILLFISMTQQPLVIKATKLIPVSLTTFTKVLDWSYKGFAVLNQMKN